MSEIKTNKISSLDSSNSDITLDPDGTGKVAIPAAVEVDSNDITVAFSGADDVNSLILQGSNGSSEKYTFELQADGGGSVTKFMVGSGGGSASEKMRMDSDGHVHIANTAHVINVNEIFSVTGKTGMEHSGSAPLHIMRLSDTGVAVNFGNQGVDGVGSISVGTASTSYNTSSDYRLKENVADMTGAIDRVKALAPKRFNFIADADTTVDGFLAHEAQTVVPEAVIGSHNEVDEDGNAVMQGIDQSKLVPLLTGALQEAIAKIEALEARVTALENA